MFSWVKARACLSLTQTDSNRLGDIQREFPVLSVDVRNHDLILKLLKF
jgi:hypothetical protein